MGDVLALAALLVVAIVPVSQQLVRPAPQVIGVEARIQLGWEIENRRALAEGVLPLWNPFHFGGRPHLADPQTLAVYPPHVVLRFLPLDLFFPVSFVLHAWVAGIGGYMIWRQLAASRLAAFAGAVAVMLVTVLAPSRDLVYSPGVYAVAWVPLIVALSMRSVRRLDRLPHGALVISFAVAVLSGSPRGAVYALLAALAGYFLAVLWPTTVPLHRNHLLSQLGWLLCLACGLTTFQTIPAVRLLASVGERGGLSYDAPGEDSWHSDVEKDARGRENAFGRWSSRSGRLVSACDAAIDDSQIIMAGVPGAGGAGGLLLADYARFANVASGLYPEKPAQYQGLAAAGGSPTRFDLLKLMDVGLLASCTQPASDRWALVGPLPMGAVYRQPRPLNRAFWTCAPEAVGRDEMIHRLTHYRYDDSLTLLERRFANVRWAGSVNEAARVRLEEAFQIERDRFLGERTWRYELADTSRARLGAIVSSPSVEDTAGIDRGTFDLLPVAPPDFRAEEKSEWLLGTRQCDAPRPAAILASDRSDGRTVLQINAPRDGVVFVSETYYPDRVARIDGRAVETLKTNLAFTAVPVTRGTHRIELQYSPRAFQVGAAISALTLVAWGCAAWRSRSRG